MKFAAIADIHGNCLALEAVLADIAALGVTDIVNLGDHVSGPLEARRTAELLMASDIVSISGDQDRRLVEARRDGTGAERADFRQLDGSHLDWLATLPQTLLYRGEVLPCHGSPRRDDVYWLDRLSADGVLHASPIEEVEADAEGIAASLILCAHTHIPRFIRLRDGRAVVNPGSVGCPAYMVRGTNGHKVETGTPDACYAVLENGKSGWQVTFRYVPYDHMAMAEMARQAGLPHWANALATGRVD